MFGTYEKLLLVDATVKMEAEDQPYRGKLGVAYVIMNRHRKWKKAISDVVLDPYDFSAWNTDSNVKMRIDEWTEDMWDQCFKAACSAFYELEKDPTNGADHYLNEALTIKIRGGDLPNWITQMDKMVVIGDHTFYRRKI